MEGIFPCRCQCIMLCVEKGKNMDREEYLSILTEQIHNKHARELVRDEILAHIEDQKEAFKLEGMEEEEAEELAVKEMGSPVEAGTQLDKVHRPKTSPWLIGSVLLLMLAGIWMQNIIFSQWDNAAISTGYSIRTVCYNLLGAAVIAAICFFDYRLLGKYIRLLYPAYLLVSFMIPTVLRVCGGSWLHMLAAGSMVYMMFAVLFAVIVYELRGGGWKGIFKAFGILLFNNILLLLFGYYLSGMAMFSVMTCLFVILAAAGKGFFGGNGKKQAGILATVVIGLPTIFIGDIVLFAGRHLSLAEYQIMRIQVMLHPSAYENEEGYISSMVRKQLALSELFGSGSLGEIGHISGSYTDYILTCITSYFGVLAAAAVVLVIAVFLISILHASFKQKNRLGFLVGLACSSILLMKTLLYVAMNFGFGLAIGMDMPFLSYGLSNTLMNAIFTGLIFSVYRHTNLLQEKKEKKNKKVLAIFSNL